MWGNYKTTTIWRLAIRRTFWYLHIHCHPVTGGLYRLLEPFEWPMTGWIFGSTCCFWACYHFPPDHCPHPFHWRANINSSVFWFPGFHSTLNARRSWLCIGIEQFSTRSSCLFMGLSGYQAVRKLDILFSLWTQLAGVVKVDSPGAGEEPHLLDRASR